MRCYRGSKIEGSRKRKIRGGVRLTD